MPLSHALITGASGFVGYNLAALLAAEGRRVRCLVRPSSRVELLEPLAVELQRGSLDDEASLRQAVAGVDVVFHVAGRTSALAIDEYVRDNVDGTRRLAAVCSTQSRPPVLVLVSSLAAGGIGTLGAPRRESELEAPLSHYGRSKLAAERTAAEFADGAPISVVRPPMVFGPADRATLSLFQSLRVIPLHLVPGFRGFPLSLVYAEDLCRALIAVAERGERLAPAVDHVVDRWPGRGVYYAATDRPINYRDLGRLAAQSAHITAAMMPTPPAAFWIAGAIGEVIGRVRRRATLLNFDKAREATAAGWVCSDEKLRSQLGYQTEQTLEERFAETVAWYRRQKWL